MLIDITSLLSKDKLVAQALRSLIEAQLDGLGAVSGIERQHLLNSFGFGSLVKGDLIFFGDRGNPDNSVNPV